MKAHILLVGDYNPDVTAHRAIPLALSMSSEQLGVELEVQWLPTDTELSSDNEQLAAANGVWCVPASPYASTDGAINAIRFSREQGIPFLGTCGGFQHAVLEYAANVLRIRAVHAELEPDAVDPLIAPLACSLVEEEGNVIVVPGTKVGMLYGVGTSREKYHCRYGLAREHEATLFDDSFIASARDDNGEVRAIELVTHPFFVATLFQPERAALRNVVHPVSRGFVEAAVAHMSARV